MNRANIYPYLVSGLIDPEWEPITVPIGHGLYATLFEDTESDAGLVHAAVAPDTLKAAGLTPEEAHRIALDNLLRFADTDERLSIQMLGRPGEGVNFLLYSDHPRASACLRLPDLYEQARELLETDELCACVPQRESLVVLPKRDRAYREMLVAKLREIEADAHGPISFQLFDLSPAGVRPFAEPT
ncbi:MAG: hypothetical protein JWO38_1821 [Gemmataceae bacterium]|nr:hypothetical protein [Gemmataceae bacterium]